MNIYAKPYGFWGEDLWIFFFENLATNQKTKSAIWTKFIRLVDDYSRNISVTFCQNICNESAWARTIKNVIYVEADVMNIYAKPYGFWGEDLWIFFYENLAFRLPWQPIKISDFDKILMFGGGLLQEHFCKTFVKISAVTQK